MKSCVYLLIGFLAPLTCGHQRTLLHRRLPALGEVNITVGKRQSGEIPLVHVVTHQGNADESAESNTPTCGFFIGNLATRKRVTSLRAKINFDEEEQWHHPDMDLTAVEIIERSNYPAETHFARTEDGFLLEMHRIPQPDGFPVLLQHGFLSSSTTWILNGPENGLAYILWDLGYDVWLGNLRGNNYAQRHLHLTKEDTEFWDHSFHEMGVYDLPAEIDYILRWTGKQKLNYIGHSMGTTVFFVMASERPEYNGKIRQMHALAPVCYLSRMRSPLKLMTLFMDGYNSKDFMPKSDFWKHFARQYCKDGSSTQWMCAEPLFFICGRNPSQLNTTLLPLIFSHFPAGVSLKTAMHFGQDLKSGKFRQYDYGVRGNLEKYGTPQPPDYDLSKVTSPVYMYYAENDWLVHKSNLKRLCDEIPGCKFMYRVPQRKFNHMDFTWAIDSKPLLFNILLKKLKEK